VLLLLREILILEFAVTEFGRKISPKKLSPKNVNGPKKVSDIRNGLNFGMMVEGPNVHKISKIGKWEIHVTRLNNF